MGAATTGKTTAFPMILGSTLIAALALVGYLGWRVMHPARATRRAGEMADAPEPETAAAPGATWSPPPRAYPSPAAPVAAQRSDQAPPPSAARQEVRAIFERRLPTLGSVAQVDGFLDELRAGARARHAVTAAEVEPGLMAIRQLDGQISHDEVLRKEIAFSQEMKQLAGEYRDSQPPVGANP